MARNRKYSLGLALLAIGGAAAIIWAMRPSGDTDFRWIGPKTKDIRAMLAALDEPIDPAELRDPVKLKHALEWLSENAEARGKTFTVLVNVDALKGNDPEAEPYEVEVQYPHESGPITVKQFLRLTFAQSGRRDIAFILRQQGFIEVTTAQDGELQRDRYFTLNGVSRFDRMRQYCSESFGSDGHLPPSPHGIK